MKSLKFSGLLLLAFFTIIALVMNCELPDDPNTPENTRVFTFITTEDSIHHEHFLDDTTGKVFKIGASLKLAENLDSLQLTVSSKSEMILDTMLDELPETELFYDTLWKEFIIFAPGIYNIVLTPYAQIAIDPDTFTLSLEVPDSMPENNPPEISIEGTTVLTPGETCELTVTVTDSDELQSQNLSISGQDEAASFNNGVFSWETPEDFEGDDTITFIAMDNGYPKQTDTQVVIIIVTSTPHYPEITVEGTLEYTGLESCTLTVTTSDEDEDQTLSLSLDGNPDGAAINDESLFIWDIPDFLSDTTVTITFTVTDDGTPNLSAIESVTLSISALQAHWTKESVPHTMSDDATYTLDLMTLWSREDDPGVRFDLITNDPENDYISDGVYTYSASEGESGSFTAQVIAERSDDSMDTLSLEITVTNEPITDLSLSSVTLSSGSNTEYTSPVPEELPDTIAHDITTIDITPTATDSRATITVEDEDVTSGASATFDIATGYNTFTIVVTGTDEETSETYIVAVYRRADPITLSSVSFSAGTLREQAAPVPDTIYDTVSFYDSTITLNVAALNETSTIKINDEVLASGEASSAISLSVSDNEIELKVISADESSEKIYIAYVTRKANSTVELSDPPANPEAEATSDSTILVSWDDLFGANIYTVERSESESEGFEERGTTTSNSFLDTSLEEGATWYYRIKASNANNSSDYSSTVSATTWKAPSLSKHPENKSAIDGGTVTFTVIASGIPDPEYQWQKNGEDIFDATSDSYETPALTLDDNQADFRCVVTNSAGSVNSDEATLSVDANVVAPELTSHPDDTTVPAGAELSFTIDATGTSLEYVWYLNSAEISETSSSLSIPDAGTDDAGTYTVKVRNSKDSVTTDPFTLAVLPNTPAGLAPLIKSPTSTEVSWQSAKGALWYKLFRSENDGTFESICSTATTSFLDEGLNDASKYTYKLIAGNNDGISDTTDTISATTWQAPSITRQPAAITITHGEKLELSLTATGVPACEFQWRKDGEDLDGESSADYVVNSATVADAGVYHVKAWNDADSAISNSVKVTVVPDTPSELTITARTSTSADAGWSAADGAEWYKLLRAGSTGAFTVICSVTTTSYVDTPLTEDTDYRYTVIAGNSDSLSDSSNVATLSTLKAPSITTQPQNTSITYGGTLQLTVAASGVPDCEYEWFKGSGTTGQTGTTFEITGVGLDAAGSYHAVASNGAGEAASRSAVVKVVPETPTGLAVDDYTSTSATLIWNSAGGASTYSLLRSTNQTSGYALVATIDNGTSYQDKTLSDGDDYYYRVFAENDDGSSDTTDPVKVSTPAIYELSTSVSPSTTYGSVSQNPTGTEFTSGTEVTLTAVPQSSSYQFTGWSGSGTSGTTNPLEVTMDGNKSITATFARIYTLYTVVSPAGAGTITPSTGGKYTEGTDVTLSVTTNPGFRFTGWTGATATGTGTATVTMNATKTVTANFVKQYTLRVESSDTNKGTVTPASVDVDSGGSTSITASVNDNFLFDGWSSSDNGASIKSPNNTTTEVTLTGDATVTANFSCVTFAKQIPEGSGNQWSVAATDDGGYIVVDSDLLIKLDSEGNTSWTTEVSSGRSIQKAGDLYIVAGGNNGQLEMLGFYPSTGNKALSFYKYDPDTSYTGMMAKKFGDNYYIVGDKNKDVFFIKTNSTASFQSEHVFDIGSYDDLQDFQQLSTGEFLLAGSASMSAKPCLIKTNSSGSMLWKYYFSDNLAECNLVALTCIQLEDTDCIISGWTTASTFGFLTKMSTTDTTQKSFFKKYTSLTGIYGFVVTNDGYMVVGATLNGEHQNDDILVAKIDKNGNMGEQHTYGTDNYDRGYSIAQAKDGGFIIVGNNSLVIKTDENGDVKDPGEY